MSITLGVTSSLILFDHYQPPVPLPQFPSSSGQSGPLSVPEADSQEGRRQHDKETEGHTLTMSCHPPSLKVEVIVYVWASESLVFDDWVLTCRSFVAERTSETRVSEHHPVHASYRLRDCTRRSGLVQRNHCHPHLTLHQIHDLFRERKTKITADPYGRWSADEDGRVPAQNPVKG